MAQTKWASSDEWKRLQTQNKQNTKGERNNRGHSRHRLGPQPPHVAKEKLKVTLGHEPTALDMYKRYKVTSEGQYLDPDGHILVERLEGADRRRREADPEGTQYSQAADIDSYVKAVGLTSRSGLPRLLGSAATLVEGTPFQLSQQIAHSVSSVNMGGGPSDGSTMTALMEQMRAEMAEARAEIARRDEEARAEIARRDEEARAREEAIIRRTEVELIRRTDRIETRLHDDLQRVTELLQRALASRPDDSHPPPPRS